MISDLLKKVLQDAETTFYVIYFVLFSQIVSIAISLYYLNREKYAKLFFLYSFSAFLLMITNHILVLLPATQYIVESSNMIFSFIEYLVFFLFFRKLLSSELVKKIMTSFLVLYALLVAGFSTYILYWKPAPHFIMKVSDFIISPELFFLACLCLVYYFELFRKKPLYDLKSSPSFWITTGLFIYCIVIVPFFLISDELLAIQKAFYYEAYTVHYFSFGCLFLAISRAFLFKKALTL